MKAQPKNDNQDDTIDIDYITFMCMNRLGFTYSQTMHMYFGKFVDLFEIYKEVYNFETKRLLYKLEEEKKVTSLIEL